jgi:hypothetical protein
MPQQPACMPPPPTSPRKPISEILGRYNKEKDAGQVAVHLAQFYYFGVTAMSQTTATRQDLSKMEAMKELITAKFSAK